MTNNTSGTIFGHPKGLYVLFFTEMWERFSWYGMKTLLILYMLNFHLWSQEDASDLLGWYGFLAYGLPVFGGMIADRVLGQRRAIILGALLLSSGHLCMVLADVLTYFYIALGLIISGVALLKPNISTQVGALYETGDPRRDGAFTIFYMGINLGGLFGPLVCGWLREHYGYHYGFSAAGVGMLLGLAVYIIGQRTLVEFQQESDEPEETTPVVPQHVVRDRVVVLIIVCLFQILFWTAFEQSPNAMMVWADKHTNLRLASTVPHEVVLEENLPTGDDSSTAGAGLVQDLEGWISDPDVTPEQTQSFNSFFIITIAPILAFIWLWLDRRNKQPSTPAKMVLGLIFIMLAFTLMWPAAQSESRPTSATVSALPRTVEADQKGRLFSMDEEYPDKRDYYGATRLTFDASTHTLHMNGVLTDLDRLHLLVASASAPFTQSIDELVKQATARTESAAGDQWELTVKLPTAPDGFKIIGSEAEEAVKDWNPETKTITITKEINARARAELLAMAADPSFKQAVDKIYRESSMFRVSVWWLIAFYLFLTVGELCVSPVGLSLVTKLAPAKNVGLFMGMWFLATAISEKTAHLFGAHWGEMTPATYFSIFIVMCGVGAVLMAVLVPAMKRMMHGAD